MYVHPTCMLVGVDHHTHTVFSTELVAQNEKHHLSHFLITSCSSEIVYHAFFLICNASAEKLSRAGE